MAKVKKENPDKIGIGKFWAWQSRGVSAAVNYIILGYVSFYCINALNMPTALVGTLLMVSKIADAVTDLFAGYLVDKTDSRFGKGRPYEFAIIGSWLATWLLFSVPGEASLTIKSIWVLAMYICVNAICTTLLSACNNPYMIRAFKTNGQRVKIASFGGIVIMFCSIAVNVFLPTLVNRTAKSAGGWSSLILMIAIPMAIIGIMRFLFVKETIKVEVAEEKPKLKDVGIVLKRNPYVYMVAFMQIAYAMVTNMGIAQFFYEVVVGDLELMGTANAMSIVVLPLLAIFPMLMKKLPMGKMIMLGSIAYVISGLLIFTAGSNFTMIVIGVIFMGIGALPITYLTDLMMIDCGSYNAWKGYQRMDGTIGAIKGFASKTGGALGSGIMGILLGVAGYNGALDVQPDSAILMIRALMGLTPVILFGIITVMMFFYKLDKLMPEINKTIEEKVEEANK